MQQRQAAVIRAAQAEDTITALGSYRFATLFQHGTMDVGVYAPRGEDTQHPHPKDELYLIRSGHARLWCEGERHELTVGDLAFVAAHAEHRFEDMSDDFSTWVLFYGVIGGESTSPA